MDVPDVGPPPMGSDWAKVRIGRLLCEQPERPSLRFAATDIGIPRESGLLLPGIGFALQ
jgi:hypothetical protein